MNENIKISIATSEDTTGIANVQKQTWLATYITPESGLTSEDIEGEGLDSTARLEKLSKSIKDDLTRKTWVAKNDGKVVGYARATKAEKHELNSLYVLPEYQSQGMGTMLITH